MPAPRPKSSLTLGTTPPFSSPANLDLPPISALFLIDFDIKAGYTIAWKNAVDGLELEGEVEYKSLPSGLHQVHEDLVYFVHRGSHAGLSAFVNLPTDDDVERHARMIAVGVLVPLSYGRLGRAWRHADGLKALATALARDRQDTTLLDAYWRDNKPRSDTQTASRPAGGEEASASSASLAVPSPSARAANKGHARKRSASDAAALSVAENRLTPFHPAWSLTSLLDTFGPLVFPIHRAALLRRRILISCHAPVHEACDFVYDISVLSNIPLATMNDTLPEDAPTRRLRPLFNIGVHDMPFLIEDASASQRRRNPDEAIQEDEEQEEEEKGTGWIACTTDSILAIKDSLWDVLITMPPEYASNARERVWPTVELPGKRIVKATQRDLRRYNALRTGLHRLAATARSDSDASETADDEDPNQATTGASTYSSPERVAEPPTWAALAYNGFMWWASAGEQLRSEEHEEAQRDAALLADLDRASHPASMSMPSPVSQECLLNTPLTALTSPGRRGDSAAKMELAIIAYFHRLTTQMLSVLGMAIEDAGPGYADDREEEEEEDLDEEGAGEAATGRDRAPLLRPRAGQAPREDSGPVVRVDSRCVERMGLDVWSEGDALFISELSRRYFGQAASIEGRRVEVCGVRVC